MAQRPMGGRRAACSLAGGVAPRLPRLLPVPTGAEGQVEPRGRHVTHGGATSLNFKR